MNPRPSNTEPSSTDRPSSRGLRWYEQGDEPDYRFSLANERTFLAWLRTALAFLAGAVVIEQIGLRSAPSWVGMAVVTGLGLLSAGLGLGAYGHWRANEIAMRHAHPLPQSSLLPLLTIAVVGLGVGLTAVHVLR